jgi:hypothetical protein
MIKLSDTTKVIKKLHCYWDDDSNLELINRVLFEYKNNNPKYEIELMNKDIIKNFLKQEHTTLHKYFDLFNIYAIRSDIARLVYLYLYGGFYCDLHVSVGNIDLVEIKTPEGSNINAKSFLGDGTLGFMYSTKNNNLLLDCLNICEYKVKQLINSNLIGPNQYCKEMHIASGNGLYYYNRLDKSMCSDEDPNNVASYFGNLIGGNIFILYGSAIMTANNTRANNKHWNDLCKEVSFIKQNI